jgi:hypothetical protein
MTQNVHWEYKVLAPGGVIKSVKPEDLESQLNALGQEGWEMTGFTATENSGKMWVVLKRQIGGPAAKGDGSGWGKW